MGRPRSFDEDAVLRAAAAVFVRGGYEGTSIDDLVTALNLHRGSLYKAFGSKRGLFLAALDRYVRIDLAARVEPDSVDGLTHGDTLDLLLVAALERGPIDAEVATLVRAGLLILDTGATRPGPDQVHALLGARLCERLHPPPPKET